MSSTFQMLMIMVIISVITLFLPSPLHFFSSIFFFVRGSVIKINLSSWSKGPITFCLTSLQTQLDILEPPGGNFGFRRQCGIAGGERPAMLGWHSNMYLYWQYTNYPLSIGMNSRSISVQHYSDVSLFQCWETSRWYLPHCVILYSNNWFPLFSRHWKPETCKDPPKVVFHQRSSSTEACLPQKVVFHQRLSST